MKDLPIALNSPVQASSLESRPCARLAKYSSESMEITRAIRDARESDLI
jgi:hypothetical protein